MSGQPCAAGFAGSRLRLAPRTGTRAPGLHTAGDAPASLTSPAAPVVAETDRPLLSAHPFPG
ncbi:hypothetical protein GCM10010206_49990 [Streptomyces cinerochromogenes]|nr:hypothetical protein GCM10010206_49990 [Streptomyces cinerochromogenes]